jgi:dTDP-4-amino-4,6-dideoxygalactose transaminase
MISMFDFQRRNEELKDKIQDSFNRVLVSAKFIGGDEVVAFENDFAKYIGAKYCVGVGNGLDALRLSLIALGVKPGAEVIVPAQTFIATWLAVVQVGAIPVPVDVLLESGNIDYKKIENAITEKTVAVIAVHLHGKMCDLESLSKITKKHKIFLIEDAAQAHGAKFLERKAGSWGDVAAFSFYPTKNLGALGDAGCVVTNNESLAAQITSLRSYGASPENKYSHKVKGWNSRLDPIQASVLREFLPYLDTWNKERQSVAAIYLDAFSKNELINPLHSEIDVNSSVWHHFVVRPKNRATFQSRLASQGVESDIHYPIAPFQSLSFRSYFQDQKLAEESFPNATALAATVCSIPLHPWVRKDLDTIIHAVKKSI